jgi:hypothetical protein
MPAVAWQKTEKIDLGPAESVTKTYTLPANLSFRVFQSDALIKRAEATGDYPRRGMSYYAEVREAEPPPDVPAAAAQAGAAAMPADPMPVAKQAARPGFPGAVASRSAVMGY